MSEFIARSFVLGIGATALMDIWALFLHAAFAQPLPNWGLVGRWFAHVPRGTVFHEDIALAAPVPRETAIGWAAHYLVGIAYAAALLLIAGPQWSVHPTFLPAFVLGIVTVGAGWFLLQPGMGAGWAASRRASPMRIRAMNLLAHTVFATGLYGTALLAK